MAGLIDQQLIAAEVLEPTASSRNAALLVGAVQQQAEFAATPPVVVVDGLDEARGQSFTVARDLLVRLAANATVVVSTRDVAEPGSDTGNTLLRVLEPVEKLDLDDPVWAESRRGAMTGYVTGRLSGIDPRMGGAPVAELLTTASGDVTEQPFLLARLVADQLRAHPIDTTAPGWEDGVALSIVSAVGADIDTIPSPQHRDLPAGVSPSVLARRFLVVLTWALGAGLPEEEWTGIAAPLCSGLGVGEVGPDDVTWVLEHLGRYVVQDGEAGTPVYRVAHQTWPTICAPRSLPPPTRSSTLPRFR